MQELFAGTKEALDNLSLYKTSATDDVMFEDVDDFTLAMEHFDDLKEQQGYETVWSMYEFGTKPLEFAVFTNKPRRVTYKCLKSAGTGHGAEWVEFSTLAVDGTIGGLWRAAESLFKQAQLAVGDWHYFIEDFVFGEDGTLELVTGS